MNDALMDKSGFGSCQRYLSDTIVSPSVKFGGWRLWCGAIFQELGVAPQFQCKELILMLQHMKIFNAPNRSPVFCRLQKNLFFFLMFILFNFLKVVTLK